MPEMDLASVSCAIQNMWLAARAEGLGMGWVSIFEPKELAQLLGIPDDAKPVAILCLGHVNSFYKEPMLVETGWKTARPLQDMVLENGWDSKK
jgi:5,6-dimethylbenzimidazole synthase